MRKTLAKAFKKNIAFSRHSKVLYTLFLLVLIFSLTITSSIAWLTSNRKTDSNELGMGLEVDDTSAVYKAYMYNHETESGTDKLPGSETGEELNISNLSLNQYDTIFSVKNKYTPAFAQIHITSKESMPRSGTVHLTISRTSAETTSDALSLVASNIIRFTAFIDSSGNDAQITDANELYNYINTDDRFAEADIYTGNVRDSKTFVTLSGNVGNRTYTTAETVTLSVDYSATDWHIDSYGKDALNVYLYITYDKELVTCYREENEDYSLSLKDMNIVFANDLDRINVSYTSKSE